MSAYVPIVLQNDFSCGDEEHVSRTNTGLEILVHRTGHADSLIAEFSRRGAFAETFATQSFQLRTYRCIAVDRRFGSLATGSS